MESRAEGEAWRSSNVQFLQGWDFLPDGQERTTVTVEHAQGNRYGNIFLFLDTYHRNDTSYDFYGEFYLQPSLSGVSGIPLKAGPLSDVSLSFGINAASDPKNDAFRAFLAGVRLDFAVPGFDFFQLHFHAYKNDELAGYGLQITPVWSVPVEVGPARLTLRGWFDWTSPGGTSGGHWYLLAQPQVLLDVGHFFHKDDQLFVGLEYHHWQNQYGIKGLNESSPQAMLMAKF